MKVIDLLNMAARGEKLPTKIKLRGVVWDLEAIPDMYSALVETPYGRHPYLLIEVLDGVFGKGLLNENVEEVE